MNKTLNQKAWFFVIPVFALVAFNAVVPLMTVVNYSFQETFGSNVFQWEGTRWFKEILHSERFHASLGRQFIFTFIDNFVQIFLPEGLKGSFPDTQSINAPMLPLYLIPTGLIVSPLKISTPSTYSSFAGFESIFFNALPGIFNSNVCSDF